MLNRLLAIAFLSLAACSTPTPESLDLPQVDITHPVVTTAGTAHYPVRVKQVFRNGVLGRQYTVWLYPLFPLGDILGKEIQYLVLDPRQPDPILGFEDRSFTAEVAEPTEKKVTLRVREAFQAEGYTFADDWLLLLAHPAPLPAAE